MAQRATWYSAQNDAQAACARCEELLQRETLPESAHLAMGVLSDVFTRFGEDVSRVCYPGMTPQTHSMLILGRIIDQLASQGILTGPTMVEAACKLVHDIARADRSRPLDVTLIDNLAMVFVN